MKFREGGLNKEKTVLIILWDQHVMIHSVKYGKIMINIVMFHKNCQGVINIFW